MDSSDFMWHPGNNGKLYESSGSRNAFFDKWDPAFKHASPNSAHQIEALKMIADTFGRDRAVCWLKETTAQGDAVGPDKNSAEDKTSGQNKTSGQEEIAGSEKTAGPE